jgi:hypothetical protein
MRRGSGASYVHAWVLASIACTAGEPASPSAGSAANVPFAADAAPDEASVPGAVLVDDAGDDAGNDAGDDAGADAGSAELTDPCLDAGDRGDGATFTDLYRDFFGPSGLASCGARSICHVPNGTGAQTSGYLCAPDAHGCWASMTSTIVPDGGSATPEATALYEALRKAPPTPGSGPMPRNSTFAFCPGDLARIRAWIAAGALP